MFISIVIVLILVLLLYNYKTGIITTIMVITNFGEFIYVNPNLEVGDLGGIGNIYFTDLFAIALIIVIFLKRDKLSSLNYKVSFLVLFLLFIISLIIPFLISAYSIKDTISVIRPLANFLILPYFVVTIIDLNSFNFFEKIIIYMSVIFLGAQIYEFISQERIPIRLFEKESVFFGENPFTVEFGGIKTGYIWSRIAYILPFTLFLGCYYYFTYRKNFGLFLVVVYILSIMISLSRIWIVGFVVFLLTLCLFLAFRQGKDNLVRAKLFKLISSFIILGTILAFTSETFTKIINIFFLRVDSINGIAEKTDASFISREYLLIQMVNVWHEYPIFGTGFSSITRRLISNDLGFPNLITIFGVFGIIMFLFFFKQFYDNIKPFTKNYYMLFVSLFSTMVMITFMNSFSLDMFYFNATGAMLLAIGNILYNIANKESQTQ